MRDSGRLGSTGTTIAVLAGSVAALTAVTTMAQERLPGAPCPGAEASTVFAYPPFRGDRGRFSAGLLVTRDGVVFVAGHSTRENPWIRRSRDGGNTWEVLVGGPVERPEELHDKGRFGLFTMDSAETLYAFRREDMLRSRDGGESWVELPFTLRQDLLAEEPNREVRIWGITRHAPPGEIWVGAHYRNRNTARSTAVLHRTLDGGETWETTHRLDREENVTVAMTPSGALFWLTRDKSVDFQSPSYLRTSRDRGATWERRTLGVNGEVISIDGVEAYFLVPSVFDLLDTLVTPLFATREGVVFLSTRAFEHPRFVGTRRTHAFWRTEDDGKNWSIQPMTPWTDRNVSWSVRGIDEDAAGRIVILAVEKDPDRDRQEEDSEILARSEDGGATWCTLQVDRCTRGGGESIAVDPPGNVYSGYTIRCAGLDWGHHPLYIRKIPAADAPFRRGDANGDGARNLTDAVFTLNRLFLGGPAPGCEDAADADDDGSLQITDAVYTLNFLFRGGRAIPEPAGPECGPDPSEDELRCGGFASCP